jgi:type III secretion protein J
MPLSRLLALALAPVRLLRAAQLATCLLLVGCSGKVALFSQLDENEANEMLAILTPREIAVTKEPGKEEKWVLKVSTDDFARAVELLKAQGYPREKFATMGEVFQKAGLVSSPTEERIRYMYALSQEIADTLTHIDGVTSARVHIVIPNNDPLAEKITPSSCAVFIRYRQGFDLESLAPQLKNLVTRSIEGLNYDNVTLVLVPSAAAAVTPPPAADTRPADAAAATSPRNLGVTAAAALIAGALGWFFQRTLSLRAAKQPAAV